MALLPGPGHTPIARGPAQEGEEEMNRGQKLGWSRTGVRGSPGALMLRCRKGL